jgi:hypothetical protein
MMTTKSAKKTKGPARKAPKTKHAAKAAKGARKTNSRAENGGHSVLYESFVNERTSTRIKLRLDYALKFLVFAGPIAWDQQHARTIMQRYREFLPKASEDLGIFLSLKTVLSCAPFSQELWGKRICLLMCCYNGPEADGTKALGPLLDALPDPWFNWMSVMPYPAVRPEHV